MAKSLIVTKNDWKLNNVVLKKGDEFDPDFFKINRFHVARYVRLGWLWYGDVERDFETVLKENKPKKTVLKENKPKKKEKKKTPVRAKRKETPKKEK